MGPVGLCPTSFVVVVAKVVLAIDDVSPHNVFITFDLLQIRDHLSEKASENSSNAFEAFQDA